MGDRQRGTRQTLKDSQLLQAALTIYSVIVFLRLEDAEMNTEGPNLVPVGNKSRIISMEFGPGLLVR